MRLAAFILLITFSGVGFCQQNLVFGKPGKKRLVFLLGDDIGVETFDKTIHAGKLTFLAKDKVGVNDKIIQLDSINKIVFVDKLLWLRHKGYSAIGTGVALLTVDALHRTINLRTHTFDEANLGVFGAFVVLGSMMLPFKHKKKKVKDKRPLFVLDLE